MADYSQFAFALAVDNSEVAIFVAGRKVGTIPVTAVPHQNYVLNEDGTPMLDENGNPVLAE